MGVEQYLHFRKIKGMEYPVLWINVYGNLNDDDFDRFTDFFSSHINKEDFKTTVFFDLRYVTWAPANLVYKMGKYMIDNEINATKVINSSVILTAKHPLLVPLINLLFSIKKPNNPNLVTQELQEGWKFLDSHWNFD